MLQYILTLSKEEQDLLWTIRELCFGELFGIEIKDTPKTCALKVSPSERDLIDLIRSGTQKIDILSVHMGEPVLAEVDFKLNNFRCRKKIKFPTLRKEG
jgi:hypothetical protein